MNLIAKVCEVTGQTEENLRSRSRKREYVHARNIIWYLEKRRHARSFPQIAKEWGYDHSTVVVSVYKIDKFVEGNYYNMHGIVGEIVPKLEGSPHKMASAAYLKTFEPRPKPITVKIV